MWNDVICNNEMICNNKKEDMIWYIRIRWYVTYDRNWEGNVTKKGKRSEEVWHALKKGIGSMRVAVADGICENVRSSNLIPKRIRLIAQHKNQIEPTQQGRSKASVRRYWLDSRKYLISNIPSQRPAWVKNLISDIGGPSKKATNNWI